MLKREFEKLSGERVTTKEFEIITDWYMSCQEEKAEFVIMASRTKIVELSEAYFAAYNALIEVVMTYAGYGERVVELQRRVLSRYSRIRIEFLDETRGEHKICARRRAYEDVIQLVRKLF